MQGRRHHQFILREVFHRSGEIDLDVSIVERAVEELDMFPQVEMGIGLVRLLQRPFVVVRVEDAHFRFHVRPLE
jgi:hypothetical protein